MVEWQNPANFSNLCVTPFPRVPFLPKSSRQLGVGMFDTCGNPGPTAGVWRAEPVPRSGDLIGAQLVVERGAVDTEEARRATAVAASRVERASNEALFHPL